MTALRNVATSLSLGSSDKVKIGAVHHLSGADMSRGSLTLFVEDNASRLFEVTLYGEREQIDAILDGFRVTEIIGPRADDRPIHPHGSVAPVIPVAHQVTAEAVDGGEVMAG